MTDPEVRVSYGVKELLSRIDIRLESIDTKLDAKADIRDVDDLKSRMDAMERREEQRVAVLASQLSNRKDLFTKREKIISLALLAVGVLIQFYLARYYLHHP